LQNSPQTVYLIDASPYIFRAYYSIPPQIKAPDGMQVNAAHGFTDFLFQILKKSDATHIALAFDGSLTTSFRNEIYPDYKAQRESPPEELKRQVEWCVKVAGVLGIHCFIDDKYEADDLIGTFVAQLKDADGRIIVVSSDKDLSQLVNEKVILWDFAKDSWYDIAAVRMKFGVYPEQICDLLGLQGDSVDNIPGVPGIGPKTAIFLLQEFQSLDHLYDRIDEVAGLALRGAAGIQRKLENSRELAFISRRLATIVTDAPVSTTLSELEYKGADRSAVEALFSHLGFGTLQGRVPRYCI
jgi:5'-3' exonuclease